MTKKKRQPEVPIVIPVDFPIKRIRLLCESFADFAKDNHFTELEWIMACTFISVWYQELGVNVPHQTIEYIRNEARHFEVWRAQHDHDTPTTTS